MVGKSALLFGASGLVGSRLLKVLLTAPEYSKVIILVRESIGLKHPKLEEQVVNFEDLTQHKDCFKVKDVFCCLGTTIKKAGSQDAFRKVDVEYPLKIAKLAKEMGAEKFLVITSMGANPESKVFYSRMKGILEQKLKELDIKSLYIFQPSLLLGKRREFRFGELVFALLTKKLLFLFVGSLKKYKPIDAGKVALAMYNAAQLEIDGISYISFQRNLIYDTSSVFFLQINAALGDSPSIAFRFLNR